MTKLVEFCRYDPYDNAPKGYVAIDPESVAAVEALREYPPHVLVMLSTGDKIRVAEPYATVMKRLGEARKEGERG